MDPRRWVVPLVALLASAGMPSWGQQYEDEGFFLFLDTVFTAPQDTDEVVALNVETAAGPGDIQRQQEIVADWGADPAGRLKFGHSWPGGARVSATYWSFDNDERTIGDGAPGSTTYFAIGPTIIFQGIYYGTFGDPGHFDIVSRIEASSLEVDTGRRQRVSEDLVIDWEVGVRFASFEETMSGFYDYLDGSSAQFGDYRYGALKSNESDMAGVRVGGRGSYSIRKNISIEGGLALSALAGDVTTRSSLVPIGEANASALPSSDFLLKEDRSGTILDVDLNVVWHIAGDRYRLWAGWEHSTWNGIAVDLARKQAALFGRQLTLGTRDSVAFSGYRVGIGFLF